MSKINYPHNGILCSPRIVISPLYVLFWRDFQDTLLSEKNEVHSHVKNVSLLY